jgi:hypothetical protein
MVGGSNYLGDIGTSSSPERPFLFDMQVNETRFVVGAVGNYQPPIEQADLFLKGTLVYGQISGNDAHSKYAPRRNRNLHFVSDMVELSVSAKYLLFKLSTFSGGFGRGNWHEFGFFSFAGTGLLYFSPRAKFQGQYVRLKQLSTEGQGVIEGKDNYSLIQPVFPVGGEITYSWDPRSFNIGLNFGWRFTFTDYLDDVSTTYPDRDKLRQEKGEVAAAMSSRAREHTDDESVLIYHRAGKQRGDPSDNDSYGFLTVSFNYYLKQRGRMMSPSF